MNSAHPHKQHYPVLDGLRGLAIILVVLYHFLGPVLPVFKFGWIGIQLFFVLSGFLISASLIPYLGNKKLLPTFYHNRILRIVPVYFLFLILFFTFWFLFTSDETQASNPFYQKHWWQFFLFFQNWVYISNITEKMNHLQHLWSLAVEEQFYILYPLLLLIVYRRFSILRVFIIIIVIIFLARTLYFAFSNGGHAFSAIYWNSFFRLDALITGGALYLLFQNARGNFRLVTAIGISSFMLLLTGVMMYQSFGFENPFMATIGYSLLSGSLGYLMWNCLTKSQTWLAAFLKTKFMRFTGRISYGIFIFHWPIFLAGFAIINKFNSKYSLNLTFRNIYWINVIASVILTFLISYISFRFFERKFLSMKAKMESPEELKIEPSLN